MQPNDMRAELIRVAEATAATEERMAATLEWMAEFRPDHAERLRAMVKTAEGHAAHMRRWVETCSARPEHR
jgi:predicted NACHT family NTPase